MIYALIGVPAAGKSSLAKTMVRYMNAVIVGRDYLRMVLFGYTPNTLQAYWSLPEVERNSYEKLVTIFQDKMIKEAIKAGKDIIVDNTHLLRKDLEALKKYRQSIKYILVDVDLETALERDRQREASVGEDVLRRFFIRFEELKKNFDFKEWTPEALPIIQQQRDHKHLTFVFDLDGTLAINTSGRSPYDWKRVGEDSLNIPVKRVLDTLSDTGYKIIICSGRDRSCERITREWLDDHNISYDKLFMREGGDSRPDWVVKHELWSEIVKEYYILAMFDDRQQVVDHARSVGFDVFQVSEGDF
jgi:tRNA uridine 5-carbamoylmethylation protein Kti12